MVTVRCDLFLDFLSHVGDASSVKITVGASAHVHTNSLSRIEKRVCSKHHVSNDCARTTNVSIT